MPYIAVVAVGSYFYTVNCHQWWRVATPMGRHSQAAPLYWVREMLFCWNIYMGDAVLLTDYNGAAWEWPPLGVATTNLINN